MPRNALVNALTAPAAPSIGVPARRPRISLRVQRVIELLLSGECKTLKAAAATVGMNPDYLSNALRLPHVRVYLAQRTRETIGGAQMVAAARLVDLIHAKSEHVSADVSARLLALEGIKPASEPQVSVNIDLKAGYVIDLSMYAKGAQQIEEAKAPPPEGSTQP